MNEVITITPPATELLSASDAKAFLKIDHTDEDSLIALLITTTREMIERHCGISIGEQTRQWTVDVKVRTAYSRNLIPTVAEAIRNRDWCDGGEEEIAIPYGPVIAVTGVTRKDDNSYTAVTLNTDYFLDGSNFRAGNGRYKVTYTAGYSADTLPAGLKLIWRQFISYAYTNRQEEDIPFPGFIKYALQSYIKRSLI